MLYFGMLGQNIVEALLIAPFPTALQHALLDLFPYAKHLFIGPTDKEPGGALSTGGIFLNYNIAIFDHLQKNLFCRTKKLDIDIGVNKNASPVVMNGTNHELWFTDESLLPALR